MINFRFHIVSLTAVLLALGIGLVLGTTILDTATVDVLRNQLEGLDRDLERADERNALQQRLIGDFERETEALREQAGERLYAGELSGVPVLVVASRDLPGNTVEQVVDHVAQAGGDVVGAWSLRDRLALEEDSHVADLGEALELATEDRDRLRANLVRQLGDILFAASDPPSEDRPAVGPGDDGTTVAPGEDAEPVPALDPETEGAEPPDPAAPADELAEAAALAGALQEPGQPEEPPPDQVQPPAPTGSEPQVVARLREHGFIDYEVPDDADSDVVELPPSGLRILVVSGPDVRPTPDDLLLPMLRHLADDGPVPVVVAELPLELPEAGDDEAADPVSASLVRALRDDDQLAERVSTVDNLDRATGLMATILAVADAESGALRLGHYGLDDGASDLLPRGLEADDS